MKTGNTYWEIGADYRNFNSMDFRPCRHQIPTNFRCTSTVPSYQNFHKHLLTGECILKWNSSTNFLRIYNTTISRPSYNRNISREAHIITARVWVDITKFSTQHYYERTQPKQCSVCSVDLTIDYIFKSEVKQRKRSINSSIAQIISVKNVVNIKFINVLKET